MFMSEVPDEPVEAAAIAIVLAGMREDWDEMGEDRKDLYRHVAHEALSAALPALETTICAQIATDLRAEANEATLIELADRYAGYYQGRRSGLETAARIAEGQYVVQLRAR